MSTGIHDVEPSKLLNGSKKEKIATLEQLEDCLDSCGFGKYQWRMLGISFLGLIAHVPLMITTPYGVGVLGKFTKDDLKVWFCLTSYLGMIFSGILSGFLSDRFGRKKIIIVSYAGLSVTAVLECIFIAHSPVVFISFFQSSFLGGAFVANTTLQSEFQTRKSRDRIMMTLNFFIAISHIISVPFLFMGFMQLELIKIGSIGLSSWHIYILLTSLCSLIACLLFARLPESPKFDFTQCRYKDALETIKKIHSVNTGKSDDEFPYEIQEITNNQLECQEQGWNTWSKSKFIFKRPLIKYLTIIITMHIIFAFCFNTMKFWFTTATVLMDNNQRWHVNSTANICDLFKQNCGKYKVNAYDEFSTHCVNCVMIFLASLIPYAIVTSIIKVGKRLLLLFSLAICCSCAAFMYWYFEAIANFIVFYVFIAFGQIFVGLVQAIVIEIFPVQSKSLALSLALAASAIGSALAEGIFFSEVLYGCIVTIVVAVFIACLRFLAVLLPK